MTILYRNEYGTLKMRFVLPSVATGIFGRSFTNGDVVKVHDDGVSFVSRRPPYIAWDSDRPW